MISSAATLGSILGLPVVTVVSDSLGWRWAVLLIVPLALLVLAGTGQLRESPNPDQAMRMRDWGRNYRQVLGQRTVTALLGVMTLIVVARFGWFVYLGAYVEKALQASASTLGFVFAVGGLAHLLGSNIAPILLARYSPRRIAAVASGLMGLDLASIGLYSDESWAVFPFIVVFSACWAICFVSSSVLLLDMNPAGRSTVMALQSAAMEFGIGAGAAIGGLLLSTLDDYERAFRSLALAVPLVIILLVATTPAAGQEPTGDQPATAPSQAT